MPTRIQMKASAILVSYLRGEIHPRKRPRFDSHYLVFNVSYRWRLLCLKPENAQNPNAWELMSHERYSTVIAKR